MRARGSSDIGEMIALVVFCAAVGLLAYGGLALRRDFGKPDDRCYWMADANAGSVPCLLDTPPPDGCVPMAFIYAHQVACADRMKLADFTQKTGRRLCGQVSQQCASVVQ